MHITPYVIRERARSNNEESKMKSEEQKAMVDFLVFTRKSSIYLNSRVIHLNGQPTDLDPLCSCLAAPLKLFGTQGDRLCKLTQIFSFPRASLARAGRVGFLDLVFSFFSR